jgi:hypothetical protein
LFIGKDCTEGTHMFGGGWVSGGEVFFIGYNRNVRICYS